MKAGRVYYKGVAAGTIRGSFLTEEMQERYLAIVRARMEQMER